MASLRSSVKLFRLAAKQGRRGISTGGGSRQSATPILLGTVVAGAASYSAYKVWGSQDSRPGLVETVKSLQTALPHPATVAAAAPPQAQPSVYSQGKDHALYLWIELKPGANRRDVARAAAKLQTYVDQVADPAMRDEDDEVVAGVGFGPNFYAQVSGKTKESYVYAHRKGALGDMPSSAGDLFVHAKSNEVSKLFELAQVVVKNLPKDAVSKYEDIYSFVYRNGRDLSGFIDGTENAADEDDRREIAVEKTSGGSYVITQKWLHNLKVIDTEKDATLESWVGRQREDSVELQKKSISSHVARMTGGNGFQQPKPFQIVRQSMPFGTLSGEKGLFFIGYAASPKNHDYMLDNMVGRGVDKHCDDVMRLSTNVKGTYWYFPGVAELKKLE